MLDLKGKLKNCSKAELIQLIESVHGLDKDIDTVIHAFLISGEVGGDSTIDVLKREIESVVFGNDFIDYRHAGAFANRLATVLQTACDRIASTDPAAALSLVDHLMSMVDQVFGRADDSGGDIGMLFRDVVELWLGLAADVRESEPEGKTDWVERVLYYFERNDYGVFDAIVAHSDHLLSEQELRQLSWRFENEARKALKEEPENKAPGSYKLKLAAAHACIGMESVAVALSDMVLFEKSVLIRSPEPNTMQIASIVRFAFEIRDFDRARYWLAQTVWGQRPEEHTHLSNELYRLQGDMHGLKTNLLDAFFQQTSSYCLQGYWELADDSEKAEQRPKIETVAAQTDDLATAVEILLTIDDVAQAAKFLLSGTRQLETVFYTRLTDWVECFEAAQEWPAAILCYRALLTDILDNGRSKAYRHAARYFNKLLKLDKQQPDYGEFGNATQYIERLQQKHWRKRSFWSEAGYPNKPQ